MGDATQCPRLGCGYPIFRDPSSPTLGARTGFAACAARPRTDAPVPAASGQGRASDRRVQPLQVRVLPAVPARVARRVAVPAQGPGQHPEALSVRLRRGPRRSRGAVRAHRLRAWKAAPRAHSASGLLRLRSGASSGLAGHRYGEAVIHRAMQEADSALWLSNNSTPVPWRASATSSRPGRAAPLRSMCPWRFLFVFLCSVRRAGRPR